MNRNEALSHPILTSRFNNFRVQNLSVNYDFYIFSIKVLTHPMTIGKAVANYTPKKKKDYPKSVHLVGTDTPEVKRKNKRES